MADNLTNTEDSVEVCDMSQTEDNTHHLNGLKKNAYLSDHVTTVLVIGWQTDNEP